jgi:lantibiotic modifying enzyme
MVEFEKKLKYIKEAITQKKEIEKVIDHGLFGGTSGIALFFFYYSQYANDEKLYDKACELIEDCFEKVKNGAVYQTFAGGLAGLGWLIEHLSRNDILEIDTNETIGEIDEYLHEYMLREINQGNYDYLHSAGGIALYFLSRESNPKSKVYLNEYVEVLYKHSIADSQGVKWISEIHVQGNEKTKVYNLSLSHGMASIVAILSKIYKRGINKKKTEELLKKAISYILSKQFDIKVSNSYFPNSISLDGDKGVSSRLAWCYGDLGISVALWNVSKVLEDKELEDKSLEILLHASNRRDLQKNYVIDAGLCHGTAGIAHIFNRMYRNTNRKEFKDASGYWLNETLKMAKFDDGLAGYKAYRTEKYGGWINDFGFLEGVAGIGLAILSAISDIDPKWDECLLLS